MRNIFALLILATALQAQANTTSPKIIYGKDNRQDVSESGDWKARLAAKSVAARVFNRSFNKWDEKISFLGAPKLSDPYGAAVCEDEKFANQVTLSDCSGFLVGEDLIATAGHCVMDFEGEISNQRTEGCTDNSWMFDYVSKHGHTQIANIDANKMYGCKEVVHAVLNDTMDFAIIKLDRKVADRKPLKLRKGGKIKTGSKLFVIGAPSGLPLKIAGDARVIGNNKSDFFSTNMDTFGGNSGSPVFNATTYEVEGILVRGRTDYVDSQLNGQYCRRVNVCDQNRGDCLVTDEDIDGEQVTRIAPLLNYL